MMDLFIYVIPMWMRARHAKLFVVLVDTYELYG